MVDLSELIVKIDPMLRRLIRESFRANQLRLPALDIVIGVRAGVLTADNASLRSALEKLWQKISATCVTSSAS